MNRTLNRLSLATIGLGAVLALVATAAFAYFNASGNGAGTASTAAAPTVTLTQTSTVHGFGPGDRHVAVTGKVTTSDGAPIYVGTVTPAINVSATHWQGPVHGYTCSAADYTLSPGTAINQEESSGTDDLSFGFVQFNDSPTQDQSACENQMLVLSFTSN